MSEEGVFGADNDETGDGVIAGSALGAGANIDESGDGVIGAVVSEDGVFGAGANIDKTGAGVS